MFSRTFINKGHLAWAQFKRIESKAFFETHVSSIRRLEHVTIVAADAFETGRNVTESRQSAESNLRR
jgi:hypothetical protein